MAKQLKYMVGDMTKTRAIEVIAGIIFYFTEKVHKVVKAAFYATSLWVSLPFTN